MAGSLVKGFVVIRSPSELDVVAFHILEGKSGEVQALVVESSGAITIQRKCTLTIFTSTLFDTKDAVGRRSRCCSIYLQSQPSPNEIA